MRLAIIDFNRTIYDPETDAAVPGAAPMLAALREAGFTLVLVSMREAGRSDTLEQLGFADSFDKTLFVDEKTPELFLSLAREYGIEPEDTIVIGDHPLGEIACGTLAGMRTIRLRRGRFAHLTHEHERTKPWRTVAELVEIIPLIPLL